MKNLDNHIQNILSDKLGNLETEVSPHVWSGIESQLAQQAAAAGSTAVAKTVAAKWLWAAAITATITTATVALVLSNTSEESSTLPATEQIDVPKSEQPSVASEQAATPIATNQQATEGNTNHLIIDNTSTPIVTNPKGFESIDYNDDSEFAHTSNNFNDPADEIDPIMPEKINPITPASSPQTTASENNGYTLPKETPSAQFTPVVVDQKALRYFFITEFTQGAEYEWNMGDGTIYDTANPTHEFGEDGEYSISLNVTDKEGTVYTQQKTVKAYKPVEVKIPNIFTPNGAGFNEEFKIEVLSGQVEWTKIIIRNNAGIVFESNGEEMWRGQDRQGNDCPEGTYTYQVRGLDRNQSVIEKSGVVTLRR